MIQAAYAFWTTILNAMWHIKYNRSVRLTHVYTIAGLKQGWYCGFPGLMIVLCADVERTWKKHQWIFYILMWSTYLNEKQDAGEDNSFCERQSLTWLQL
jgi:hypothetical protein